MTPDRQKNPMLETGPLHAVVNGWFARSNDWNTETRTGQIAYDWLLKDGKRWRPFLLACTYSALNNGTADLPDEVRRLAIAVECFHKASLIHDDIEDGDTRRYGKPALHSQFGIPIAINAGDLLVGEAYRWITSVETRTAELVRIAAETHCTLCLGQGDELYGLANGTPFSTREIIENFRRKTAPAFGIALLLGAVAAGADRELLSTLRTFSEALGIAYQICDELDEYTSGESRDLRASLLLALANDRSPEAPLRADHPQLRQCLDELKAPQQTAQKLDQYRSEAARALNPLKCPRLRSLLRLVTDQMLAGQ
jgi:geranylgeranyl pyrophosphate synthase